MVQLIVPFALKIILLEGKDLEWLFLPRFAKDVKEVGLSRLQGSRSQLQVMVAEWDRLCLLPLVVKHVHSGLMRRRERRHYIPLIHSDFTGNLADNSWTTNLL